MTATTFAAPAVTAPGEHRMQLQITGLQLISDSVMEVTLTDADGRELPAWSPGAHIDLEVRPGLVRQYSLCGDHLNRNEFRIAVLREPDSRGGSQAVHEHLEVGDSIAARGPRNQFALHPAQEYLFIAGGIGITPLIPMMAHAHATGVPFRLVYGGRVRASMAYAAALESAYPGQVELCPQDETGPLRLAEILGDDHQPGRDVFCCGPARLLDAIDSHCAHWPDDTVCMERFRAIQVDTSADSAFEVELAASGQILTVAAEQSILAAVEAAGASVLSSCQEGTCGSCETPLLGGVADHRDSVLTPDEQTAQDTIMLCVSRACSSRLILDL